MARSQYSVDDMNDSTILYELYVLPRQQRRRRITDIQSILKMCSDSIVFLLGGGALHEIIYASVTNRVKKFSLRKHLIAGQTFAIGPNCHVNVSVTVTVS